jgi:glycosyltransferase involved in cell wall biosynthesis
MNKISIIVITKNESHDIRGCLESISWADEIIVLDSGSTDETRNIALEFTKQVYVEENWQGFGIQKNRALAYATKDWVLSLDADERITRELRTEIEKVITEPHCNTAFRIPRSSNYCGKFIKHSGWTPDYVVRLFRKDSAYFNNNIVHESLVIKGNIGTLKHQIRHYAFSDLEEVVDKVNRYSSAGAMQKFKQGEKSSFGKAIRHGLWAFIRTFFIQAGFLDGREGFILAVSNAEGVYYRYLKLMYLQEKMQADA